MKFLIIFAFGVAFASGFDLRNNNIESRYVVVPAAEPEGRITNGENAAVGQFPYQVGLSLKLSKTTTSWCSGSLIGNKWILTAAHCIAKVYSVTVHLGATIRTEAQIIYTTSPKDFIIHPSWRSKTSENDIALIQIPFTNYTAKVQPIQLPAIASSYPSYTDESVVVSGWGLISDSATSAATDLKWTRMRVITNLNCTQTFGSLITSTNICGSTRGGASPCRGDSGGPMVLESTTTQIGVISFGSYSGCENDKPVASTRLTSYLGWIEEHTEISY